MEKKRRTPKPKEETAKEALNTSPIVKSSLFNVTFAVTRETGTETKREPLADNDQLSFVITKVRRLDNMPGGRVELTAIDTEDSRVLKSLLGLMRFESILNVYVTVFSQAGDAIRVHRFLDCDEIFVDDLNFDWKSQDFHNLSFIFTPGSEIVDLPE